MPIESEIGQVSDSFPKIDGIFLTHSHWDHIGNIDLYPDARLIMAKQTYEQAVSEGSVSVRKRLQDAKTLISLVERRECFYDYFVFEVVGGHTPDSSVLYFQTGRDIYCITGDECYFCENMERNIPIGICSCTEKNVVFLQKAYTKGWTPLPFHDAKILEKYNRLTENIVEII